MEFFLRLYRFLMARPALYKINLHLYKLSLRGLGILNANGPEATGEHWFMKEVARRKKVKTIIDVGANTDIFGITTFPEATIYACEPHPDTFKKLASLYPKATRRKKLILCNIALGEKNATKKLWDFADDAPLKSTQPTSTLSSLDKAVIEKIHNQKAKSYPVSVQTLDTFVSQQKITHIDILKIDTEGHELQVLLGAKKTIQRGMIDIIQFEFNEMNVISKSFFYDFMQLIPEFHFYRLLPHGLVSLENYRPLTHEIFGFQNIVASREKL